MQELNEKIVGILGEDHEVSQAVMSGDDDLRVDEVLLTVLTVLVERIEKLERRISGEGVH